MSAAHEPGDIEQVLAVTDRAFAVVAGTVAPTVNHRYDRIVPSVAGEAPQPERRAGRRPGEPMPKIVDHEQRRAEVLQATWRVVTTLGLHEATTRRIAEEAGYSNGVLSHYFADKDDILVSALQMAHERARGRMETAAVAEYEGLAALRAVILEALPLDDDRLLEAQVEFGFLSRAINAKTLRDAYEDERVEFREFLTQTGLCGEGRRRDQRRVQRRRTSSPRRWCSSTVCRCRLRSYPSGYRRSCSATCSTRSCRASRPAAERRARWIFLHVKRVYACGAGRSRSPADPPARRARTRMRPQEDRKADQPADRAVQDGTATSHCSRSSASTVARSGIPSLPSTWATSAAQHVPRPQARRTDQPRDSANT